MLFFYERENTLEKKRIANLEELERKTSNQHSQNIVPTSKSPKKIEEEPSKTPQKG